MLASPEKRRNAVLSMEIVKDFANAVHFFCEVAKTRKTLPSGSARKEGGMTEESSVSRTVVASATWLPQAAGAALQWDGRSDVCHDVEAQTVSEHVQPFSFRVKGPPTPAPRARPYWKTGEICRVPVFPQQAIAWDKEAARVIFALAPVLLADTAHGVIPRATGELVWVPWQEKTEFPTPSVYPMLLGHAPCEMLQAELVTIVPSLPVRDPLLHHIALVLQAAVDAEDEAGQLYAETLADALVVHFLRRYAAARSAQREVSGGFAPYKLRRTLAYIQAHLEQKICLETLATVAQMSPTHFAHLFKHATGLAPHQYVSLCRIEHAKQLLAETDLPLIEISSRVGCTDPSHFSALFRRHVAMPPNAYRHSTRRA
jgi:AraC-like DNA-binding protein